MLHTGGETLWRLSQHKLGFTPSNPVLNLLRAQAIQHTVDVGYYAPAARTTLDRVFLCACPRARLAQSPSTFPSTPSLGIGGCVPPSGCGYPRNPAIIVNLGLTLCYLPVFLSLFSEHINDYRLFTLKVIYFFMKVGCQV